MAKFPVDPNRILLDGVKFHTQVRIELASEETKYLVLSLDDAVVDGVAKCIYGSPIQAGSTAGLVYLDTYSTESYSGGTELVINNLNHRSTNVNLAKFYEDAVPSGTIDHLREYTIGSDSTRQSSGGGFVTEGATKILANQPLVFKFENRETSANVVTFGYAWTEC